MYQCSQISKFGLMGHFVKKETSGYPQCNIAVENKVSKSENLVSNPYYYTLGKLECLT